VMGCGASVFAMSHAISRRAEAGVELPPADSPADHSS
jgi:hypothetical protein